MTDYVHITIENRVEIDRSQLEVDGVEIITRKEQEVIRDAIHRMRASIDRQITDTIMHGDGPRPKLLPR